MEILIYKYFLQNKYYLVYKHCYYKTLNYFNFYFLFLKKDAIPSGNFKTMGFDRTIVRNDICTLSNNEKHLRSIRINLLTNHAIVLE